MREQCVPGSLSSSPAREPGNEAKRTHAQRSSSAKIRLPITPAILRKIQEQWSVKSLDPDIGSYIF